MSQQPDKSEAYSTQGNAASKEPQEKSESHAQQSGSQVEQRIPSKQTSSSSEATPSASAQGIEGGGPGENPDDLTPQAKGESHVEEAEQMGAPGEGKVADAVKDRSKGNSGESQDGLESDLDRKKAEQAPRREAVQKEEKKDVDVGGVLGQRGGPASSVS